MDMNEIISELDIISELCDKQKSLENEYENVKTRKEIDDSNLKRKVVSVLDEFQKEEEKKANLIMPEISADCLAMPPKVPNSPKPSKPKFFLLRGAIIDVVNLIALVVLILGFALCSIPLLYDFVFPLLTMSMIYLFMYWLVGAMGGDKFKSWRTDCIDWSKGIVDWEEKFNKAATKAENKRFLDEFKEYDTAFLNFVDACSKKHDEELKACIAQLEIIKDNCISELNRVYNEQVVVINELYEHTVIDSELYDNAWRISGILKKGRADTLKDAINLALDDERKDNEEAARRVEAARQQAILEQQAADNRRHNEKMQRAAEEEARATKEHNAAMEKAAQEQARAAQAQAKAAQDQARIAQQQLRSR